MYATGGPRTGLSWRNGVPCRARFGVLIRAMAPSRESRVLRRLEIVRRGGLPRRFRSSMLRACGAGRYALDRSLSEDFTALGEPPNVCTRMSSRLQKLSTVPLHELDAVMCTDLGGQQLGQPPVTAAMAGWATFPIDPTVDREARFRTEPGAALLVVVRRREPGRSRMSRT